MWSTPLLVCAMCLLECLTSHLDAQNVSRIAEILLLSVNDTLSVSFRLYFVLMRWLRQCSPVNVISLVPRTHAAV